MLFDDGFFVSLMYVFQILNKDSTKEILNSFILCISLHLKENNSRNFKLFFSSIKLP